MKPKDSYKLIQVELRSSYGTDRIYPVNELARLMLQLTGRKTFFVKDLETLAEAGYSVNWMPAQLHTEGE